MSKLTQESIEIMDSIKSEKPSFNVSDQSIIDCVEFLLISLIKSNKKQAIDEIRNNPGILINAYQCKNSGEYAKSMYCNELLSAYADFISSFNEIHSKKQDEWLFDEVNKLCSMFSSLYIAKEAKDNEIKAIAVIENKKSEENNTAIIAAEHESDLAKLFGLEPLTGSPKQCAWAEKIRKAFIKDRVKLAKNGELPTASLKRLQSKGGKTAKYWIDNFKDEFKVY